MTPIYLKGIINDEFATAALTEITEALHAECNKEDKIHIYLTTPGGEYGIGCMLLDFINAYKDRIVLKAVSTIGSMGFNIFKDAQCEKELIGDVYGAIHLISFELEWRDLRNRSATDYFINAWENTQIDKAVESFSCCHMSESEIDNFRQGRVVHFNPDRMREIFKQS